MNMFNQDGFILELVTFAGKVELVVLVLVNLFGFSVFSEEVSEHSLSAHPEDLAGHSGLAGTFALTGAGVATSSFLFQVSSGSRTGVHLHGFLHDETVFDQFTNTSSCLKTLLELAKEISWDSLGSIHTLF